MRERRDGAGLPLEPRERVDVLRQVFGEHLDGDLAAEAQIPRAIDLTHSAGAQRRENLVAVEKSSGDQRHWRPFTTGPGLGQKLAAVTHATRDLLGVEVLEQRNRQTAGQAEHLFELSDVEPAPAGRPKA